MNTVLVITNRRPHEDAGRSEKIAARIRLFQERDWAVELSYVPEPYIRTFPLSVARAVKRVRETNPDVLISIVNPFHQHLIGYLASKITGKPWVAEFRDPILTHPDREGGPMRIAGAFVERLTVRNADRVVWLDGIQVPKGYFSVTYPSAPKDRLIKLPPMGFDAERFEIINPESFQNFTITYAGSFYDGWIEPYGYLDGLAAFASTEQPTLRTRFYGDWNDAYATASMRRGLNNYVSSYDFVEHDRMISILKGSDVLLYIGGIDERNRRNLPSKIWDYLGAGTPILALVDESFRVASFVEDNGLGIAVDPGDTQRVADAIQSFYDGTFEYDPNQELFSKYTRQQQAAVYTDMLLKLIGVG
jgi:glycosyltransferase involved in cell wall biosynthesis